ncbi:DUF924 family protein [Phenylobacterium kunshanense]|uniref:DUF924 domain-containing protein n=1 Tax=Phenylobacterium kunshanense TaxID=1445034 RepID=A0A328B828_9CAUL|nr:DUF924 family protein [Phenylobacterium kunshanense]RAK63580.1 DUF924 domain-containing protein [Phenylobacterium kunshanense]
MVATPNDILGFWRNAGPRQWFAARPAFDEAIRLKFEAVHHAAARGEYDKWAETPDGALALLILLDQFPRNLYRGSGHAFATDGKALAIAHAAADAGWHRQVEKELAGFMLLPFQHAEDLGDQDRGLQLARELGNPDTEKWHQIHRDVIARFGRFPHRNPMLGRPTTPEEQAFLDEGGFAG